MQLDIKKIADAADMIINGYAYTQEGKYIRILNLTCCAISNKTFKTCKNRKEFLLLNKFFRISIL